MAIELVRQRGCRVVGLDQSEGMLASARSRIDDARLADRIQLVEGSADELPFPDRSFDALTFTYLLRYVEDPAATLAELARVVRPGGAIASLEFGLPRGIWRPLWELYVRAGLPLAGRVISPGWHEVGTFLGPSIRELHARLPDLRAGRALARRGDRGRARASAQPRGRATSSGDVAVTETRSAFYALEPGGWRDYVTLLHPPYTLWHLSYVAIGARARARHVDGRGCS